MISLTISGFAGPLEALLCLPPHPMGFAVIAHPHPLFGGTMHTKVVHRTSKIFADFFHFASFRFNFRGVGASGGKYDGKREMDDVVSIVSYARSCFPRLPLALAGFSFGSLCAARAALIVEPAVVLLIGVPYDRWSDKEAHVLKRQNVVCVQGAKDQFGPGPLALEVARRHGFQAAIVQGADHFFSGHLNEFEKVVIDRLSQAGLSNFKTHT